MKKILKLLSLATMALSITACSCNDSTIKTTLNKSDNVYESNKVKTTLTTQDIYDYIRTNDDEFVNTYFLRFLMSRILDMNNNPSRLEAYNLKLKKYFQDNVLSNSDYKVNGVFNEEVFASFIESEMYSVNRENHPTSGVTYELGLSYDYSDYINSALNYDFYFEILKEEYMFNNKDGILDNSKSRIISVYSSDNLEDMEKVVEDLYNGTYANFDELINTMKLDEKKEIGRRVCMNLGITIEGNLYTEGTCSATTSNSTYDKELKEFTTCENDRRCSIEEGYAYKIRLIDEKEYLSRKLVNKDTTDILYTEALDQLFMDKERLNKYLVTIPGLANTDKFMVNGLYNDNPSEFAHKDIILSKGPDSTCYLVTVRVVDSATTNEEDKQEAFELLKDKVSERTVLSYYLEKLENVVVEDPTLLEYYQSLKGE